MSVAPPVRVGPATKLVRAGGSVTVNSDGSITVAPASGKTVTISKLATPALADDAATKGYVDSAVNPAATRLAVLTYGGF